MSNAAPWKLAVTGGVALVAGVLLACLSSWSTRDLVAFTAFVFVARASLHLVITSYSGTSGALSALTGLGELAVGLVLLVWPAATPLVVVVVVGTWAVARGTALFTTELVTRAKRSTVLVLVLSALVVVAGVVVFTRSGGGAAAIARAIGLLEVLDGTTDALVAGRDMGRRPERVADGAR